MNKSQMLTMRAMILISAGSVLLLDVFGIVKEGIAVFLAFLAIFIILYGLRLLGFWDFAYSVVRRVGESIKAKSSHFLKRKKSKKNPTATVKPKKISSVKTEKKSASKSKLNASGPKKKTK